MSLVTDLAGRILARDETSASGPNPHERRYVFADVVMGTVSNDGTDNQTFAAALAEVGSSRTVQLQYCPFVATANSELYF